MDRHEFEFYELERRLFNTTITSVDVEYFISQYKSILRPNRRLSNMIYHSIKVKTMNII